VLIAEISGEKFALSAINCKTIVKAGRLTRVPRMPGFMLGVINLRGQIVSVVDLGKLLELDTRGPSPKSRLVVTESEGVRAAFLVEQVLGIEWIEESRIKEPQSVKTSVKEEYLLGHVSPNEDEGWVTYLDIDKIVHGPELFVSRK